MEQFWVYSVASAVGVIPKVILYVYFGNVFADMIQIIAGDQPATASKLVPLFLSGAARLAAMDAC